ncbi:MAG: hypothetical protein ACQUYJ_03470, partial [Ferruginibacter sp.]
MRRCNTILYQWLVVCFMALLLMAAKSAQAQYPIKNYTVKNGKMFIALGKDLPAASLDSFIKKYELFDLNLAQYFKTGSADSLQKLGWKIDIDNKEILVISKPLFSVDNINNPADKIVLTQKAGSEVPAVANQVHFGYNRFKNKLPFAVTDSVVSFFLRGFTNANVVQLAGTFTNWQFGALPMA